MTRRTSTHRLRAHPSPTPQDLLDAPELAILAALDHTLDLAVYALVSIYPELTDPERPLWRRDASAAGHAAGIVIARTTGLKRAISEYRTALALPRETEPTEDIPF